MRHSEKCTDLATRWKESACVRCAFKPGHYVTPNCGFDDNGGRHEPPTIPCKPNTFNTGNKAYCEPCSSCPSGSLIIRPCSSIQDTQCQRNQTNDVTEKETTTQSVRKTSTIQTNSGSSGTPNETTPVPYVPSPHLQWAVPLVILISITLVVLSAVVVYVKQKKGQRTALSCNRRSSYINMGFSSLSAPPDNSDLLEDILSPAILSAPLQTVLNNLDVLEELVILLDPETQGIKNTKHLASHCSFPSTWITYTYSMRDSKSPLKAVLEGVTSRHPEWTVGHLAKMLRLMGRNDAIAALTKLQQKELDV